MNELLTEHYEVLRELMTTVFQAGYDSAMYGDWNGTGDPTLDALIIEASAQVEAGQVKA